MPRCGDAKTAEGALLRDVVGPPQSMETLDLHGVAIARRLGNLDQRRSHDRMTVELDDAKKGVRLVPVPRPWLPKRR